MWTLQKMRGVGFAYECARDTPEAAVLVVCTHNSAEWFFAIENTVIEARESFFAEVEH